MGRKPAQVRIRADSGLNWADSSQPVESGDARAADRCRRGSTLFQFSSKQLRDGIDLDLLPIRTDEQSDIAGLSAPSSDCHLRSVRRT